MTFFPPTNYCDAIINMAPDNPNIHYHNHQYGFPVVHDDLLFERLVLEINQAGLSWTTILKKQANFRAAYCQFNIAKVASFDAHDVARLLADAGIIRNRLKVAAAIHNAQVILELQAHYGSFYHWLLHHHPLDLKDWVRLFNKTFKFTGGEIVNEFLMSIGVLPGAHQPHCPVYMAVLQSQPLWLQQASHK